MVQQASLQWKRLRRYVAADPARFAGGSAVSDPLGLLAVEQERRATVARKRGGEYQKQPGKPTEATGINRRRIAVMDYKLEVVVVPVSDVNKAKDFYQALGWRLDAGGIAMSGHQSPEGS